MAQLVLVNVALIAIDRDTGSSLQSLDWTGGLDWWTGLVDWIGGLDWWTELKIIFMLFNENSPVELHLETWPLSFTDSSKHIEP